MDRQEWEYKVEVVNMTFFRTNTGNDAEYVLNGAGHQGWELTSVVQHDDQVIALVYKQPKS